MKRHARLGGPRGRRRDAHRLHRLVREVHAAIENAWMLGEGPIRREMCRAALSDGREPHEPHRRGSSHHLLTRAESLRAALRDGAQRSTGRAARCCCASDRRGGPQTSGGQTRGIISRLLRRYTRNSWRSMVMTLWRGWSSLIRTRHRSARSGWRSAYRSASVASCGR